MNVCNCAKMRPEHIVRPAPKRPPALAPFSGVLEQTVGVELLDDVAESVGVVEELAAWDQRLGCLGARSCN